MDIRMPEEVKSGDVVQVVSLAPPTYVWLAASKPRYIVDKNYPGFYLICDQRNWICNLETGELVSSQFVWMYNVLPNASFNIEEREVVPCHA